MTSAPATRRISKDLYLNIGTVRYHLMILSLNHRVVAYNDNKYVRYFINSNTYRRGELLRKGVVVKNPSPTIRASYSIDKGQVARIFSALKFINCRQRASMR